MALITRRDFYEVETKINPERIYRTSRLVSRYMGMEVSPNKAIVGANAFAHASGLHQDGMLKDSSTYEIMTPESIGVSESKIVLGKTSGRHAVRSRLEKLGHMMNLKKRLKHSRSLRIRRKKLPRLIWTRWLPMN